MSYKLTKKAEADLAALVDFSVERFDSEVASSYLDKLERASRPWPGATSTDLSLQSRHVRDRFGDGQYRLTGSTTIGPAAFFESFASTTAHASRYDAYSGFVETAF